MLRTIFKKWSKQRLPQVNGRIYLPTLHHPVTIQRDKWDIPHISAADRYDLFTAQGFVHAQERMWQLELNRRAAKGTLSELFGPLTLETDRLARTLGFARLAAQSWPHLDETARADLEAYSRGINAWLQSCPRLPIEFSLIKHRPQPWGVLDSLAYGRVQMWALTNGAMGELVQAQLIQTLGPDKAADLGLHYPLENPATLPHGIEVGSFRLDSLLGSWTHPFGGKTALEGAGRGSNGWIIGPERSASGHAILCNDMHLPVGTPSLWLAMHLHSADGLHVAGFTQPGLPYVLVGHNEHIAWGATLAYTDCEDLFIERFHPQHPSYYEFDGRWLSATVHQEEIQIRGRPSHTEAVIVTHHGPIINDVLADAAESLAYSSMALRPDVTIDGFQLLNRARDWDGFVSAVSHIQSPSLNLLYADTEDNIGYYVSGRVPIRTQGDGSVPAPGWTGEYEWLGEIPFAEMPHALNPKQRFIVSANHRITGDAYPHNLGQVWRNGYRARRIEQLIMSREKISVADCRRFHLDVYNIPGKALVKMLSHIFPETWDFGEDNAAVAWGMLRTWDGRLTPDSIGGTVYEVFIRELSEALLSPHFERPFLHKLLGMGENPFMHPVNEFQGQWLVSLLRIVGESADRWLPDREALLVNCLARTTAVLRQKLGPDPAKWTWGRLHRITFAHAMGIAPVLGRIFNQGPFPIGGDENTIAQTGIRPDLPYNNNAISISTRLIVEMGNIDQAQGMHPPGQSGHLGSPHYGDLIQPWLNGDTYQWAWTAEDVTAVTRHTLTLHPPLKP
ncbi:MAG: penicillin acylase family protein [Chloroflexi bacterium]|nr:penicillin acylase family protein [Chloroflexota bacterium]